MILWLLWALCHRHQQEQIPSRFSFYGVFFVLFFLVTTFFALSPWSSPLVRAFFNSVLLSLSFVSLSNWSIRKFSFTLHFQLQTYTRDLHSLISFCHRYIPSSGCWTQKLRWSSDSSASISATLVRTSCCFPFKLFSSFLHFLFFGWLWVVSFKGDLQKMLFFLFFFLIGLTLCLFLEYKDIFSFCLFIHCNYFFLAISGTSVLAFSEFSGCYFESSQGQLLLALTLQLTGYGRWKFNLLSP